MCICSTLSMCIDIICMHEHCICVLIFTYRLIHLHVLQAHIPLFLANPEICLSMMADPDYEDWAGWVSWVKTQHVT